MATKTCYACDRVAYPDEGRCAFCDHRMCYQHTIRATFFGDWVSWCEPCHTSYEADKAEHREAVGHVWEWVEEAQDGR